ncbi:hypothetical protein N4P33_08695 [Streptomyces sp. 15-116A]|uniref:hypothetical protein n=1 Tax=Streptomyces sp. 15-116A TaxID=2259035 RepID=UPI0021B44F11|nr:hypothetical protein [Streptomyces sp. 15-116A]MCT7352251.1 hypothetical protein [Streptomyces sp. 15-116A]
MRFFRLASATVAVAVALALPYEAMAHTRVHPERTTTDDTGSEGEDTDDLFGASCWIRIDGPDVTAYCQNPYPAVDLVSLHVECAQWWDLDSDSRAVAAEPAQTVELTGRCWQEVRSAWISHRRAS